MSRESYFWYGQLSNVSDISTDIDAVNELNTRFCEKNKRTTGHNHFIQTLEDLSTRNSIHYIIFTCHNITTKGENQKVQN